MNDSEKVYQPPMGATPYWLAVPARIKELSDAISRYAEEGKFFNTKRNTEPLREWAAEIVYQCDVIDELRKLKEA